MATEERAQGRSGECTTAAFGGFNVEGIHALLKGKQDFLAAQRGGGSGSPAGVWGLSLPGASGLVVSPPAVVVSPSVPLPVATGPPPSPAVASDEVRLADAGGLLIRGSVDVWRP